MTNVVITMAGRGSRFYKAGYSVPKYAIEVHDHTLFEWSMKSLKNIIKKDDKLIFVCLAENNSADFVTSICSRMGFSDVIIVNLSELTDGQATSAYLSQSHWRLDEALIIYNIDTYVSPDYITTDHIRKGSDGWIPCFQVPGTHWSFVRLGSDGWAVEVAEKARISEFASIGLYWFAEARLFLNAYNNFFRQSEMLINGEKYIAPLYGHLIAAGLKVSISDIPVDAVHVLGTPDELAQFATYRVMD